MPCNQPTRFSRLARRWRPDTLTQSDAARMLDIDQSTLNKIEKGSRRPSLLLLERMREVYALGDTDVSEAVAAMGDDQKDADAAGDDSAAGV